MPKKTLQFSYLFNFRICRSFLAGIWRNLGNDLYWMYGRLPVRSRSSIRVREMDPILQDGWHPNQEFRFSKPQIPRSGGNIPCAAPHNIWKGHWNISFLIVDNFPPYRGEEVEWYPRTTRTSTVTILLLFRVLPRFPAVNSNLSEHEEITSVMRAARER